MSGRVCRVCGRVYRGLVCQACHPRGSGRRGRAGRPAPCTQSGSGGDSVTGLPIEGTEQDTADAGTAAGGRREGERGAETVV